MSNLKTTLAQDRDFFASKGIHLPAEMTQYADDAAPYALQSQLVTQTSAGIPAYLANILEPKVIEVLVQKMAAVEITGERGLGSWVMLTAQFPIMERAGVVSSYGDYNNNGMMEANYNWEPREQYVYQGICQWGDRELEMLGLAKLDHANNVRASRALAFAKFQNKSYFYGVANLKNYGLLNDPTLYAAITPTTKTAGGTSWAKAQPQEMIQDITNTYAQAVKQTGQLVETSDEMVLAMSGISMGYLVGNTNSFGLNAIAKLRETFPKMRIVTAPEYTTASGELMQLIFPKLQGQETVISQYGDKLRAFPVFRAESSFRQKFAAGTWGCIIKQPMAIAQMLGI